MQFLKKLIVGKLIKGYNTQKQPISNGGVTNKWKIYKAVKENNHNQKASVFIYQKKNLKKIKGNKQDTLKFLKKEATALTKFKHPFILSIIQPLVQDQSEMGFVTQSVESTLLYALTNNNKQLLFQSQTQLKIHIVQLLEALSFIHNNVKIAHLGLSPNNIYITSDGKWKLGGFVFSSISSLNQLTDTVNIDFNCFSGLKKFPLLQYSAPQVIIHKKCSFNSDIFSIGILSLNLFNFLKQQNYKLTFQVNQIQEYQRKIKNFLNSFNNLHFLNNSKQFIFFLNNSLIYDYEARYNSNDLKNTSWLKDNYVLTIKYLQNITQLQNKQQIVFLKGLTKIIFQFQNSIIKKRILPALAQIIKFYNLNPFIVSIYIHILQQQYLSKKQFNIYIWNVIKNITTRKQISAQVLYLLIRNIQLISKNIQHSQLQSVIIPLILKCLQCKQPRLQMLAIRKVQFITKTFDYFFTKTKLLPRILLVTNDNNLQVRKFALICLYKLCHLFDTQIINDSILPVLEKNRKKGGDSFINSIILKIYLICSQGLSIEILGNKIIPSLIPYLVDSTLSKNDFEMYKSTIFTLINKIQNQRRKVIFVQENFSNQVQIQFTQKDFNFPEEKVVAKPQINRVQRKEQFDFLSDLVKQQKQQNIQQQSNKFNLINNVNNYNNTFQLNINQLNNIKVQEPKQKNMSIINDDPFKDFDKLIQTKKNYNNTTQIKNLIQFTTQTKNKNIQIKQKNDIFDFGIKNPQVQTNNLTIQNRFDKFAAFDQLLEEEFKQKQTFDITNNNNKIKKQKQIKPQIQQNDIFSDFY